MAFNSKELKRRAWTQDEKNITMKNCANRCACCGKKLTFKTLTMEHVVPFSKGGDNVIENLVALCFNCNRAKANMLYLPETFYMALNSNHLNTVSNYFKSWFNENFTIENLVEKPLLYEGVSAYITIEGIKTPTFKNGVLVPSLIMDIFEVSSSDLRELTKGLEISQKDIYNSVIDPDKLFALYAAKQRTSDTLSSLFTVQILNDRSLIFTEVYSRNTKSLASSACMLFALNAQYYKDNNISSICYRYRSEKSMYDMFGLIQRSAFAVRHGTTIPSFSYGIGDDFHIEYNGNIIKPEYGVGITFDRFDVIDYTKEQLRKNGGQ